MRWGLREAAVCTLASMALGVGFGFSYWGYWFLGAAHVICVLPCGVYARRSDDAIRPECGKPISPTLPLVER